MFVVWGSLSPVPVMHDEWAYWLQADQYAHFTGKSRRHPAPEFFEQLYVLVTPVFAAKYPPGYAMMIAPGFMVGLPALMPLLIAGVSGALVFALARRIAGSSGGCAHLGALARHVRQSALSRGVLLRDDDVALLARRVVGAAGMARDAAHAMDGRARAFNRMGRDHAAGHDAGVRNSRRRRRDARCRSRPKRWRDLAIGVTTGTLVLAILPVWSAATTGNWRETPLALYTRQYLPFDIPGYTLDATPPTRELPPEMERVRSFLRDIKKIRSSRRCGPPRSTARGCC